MRYTIPKMGFLFNLIGTYIIKLKNIINLGRNILYNLKLLNNQIFFLYLINDFFCVYVLQSRV